MNKYLIAYHFKTSNNKLSWFGNVTTSRINDLKMIKKAIAKKENDLKGHVVILNIMKMEEQ